MDKRKYFGKSLAKSLEFYMGLYAILFFVNLLILQLDFISNMIKILLGIILAIIFIWSIYSLRVRVYLPIKRVEEAMEILTAGDNKLYKSLEEVDSTALSMHLHELIQLLKESIDREYTAGILKKEAQLNALQSQINPHFLYNVLDTIRGHALMEGVTEIAEMTEALSNLFRYSISYKENVVTVERELMNVRSYFMIQQYRFNNKFDLRILIEGDKDQVLSCKLPKLTLQPIIENAIYHGLEMKMGKGLVTIRAKATDEILLIQISDDGIGIETDALKKINDRFTKWEQPNEELKASKGTGIALINVNNRIKMSYGDEYGLHMYSTKGFGAMVEILLPVSRSD